jgi:hypothetical protein
VRLPPPALEALVKGDLDAARRISGARLSDWFLSDDITWL